MATSASTMFDPEVVAEMRRQFDAADTDGSGTLDMQEAINLVARNSDPSASQEEVRRLADNLRNQMDGDRSGTISFDEYCFRFGRRYQMEAARRRRQGGRPGATVPEPAAEETEAAAKLRREREELEKEREALRREREELERARGSSGGSSPSASAGGSASTTSAGGSSSTAGSSSGTRLTPGLRVTLQGLQGAASLNGRAATVLRFDSAAGRYVVDLDGGGGQKSLRAENLLVAGDGGASTAGALGQYVKDTFRKGCAYVQVWLAEYEWWQILLGAGVIVLFVMAYFQVSARYPGDGSSGKRQAGAGRSMPRQESYRDDFDDQPYGAGGRHRDDFDDPPRRSGGRHREYSDYDYGYDGYDGGYSGGGGSMFGDHGQLYTLMLVAGIGYLCWKGIIPVHRMNWFQIYMLWNMFSPMLLGGRGGGIGRGFGRRRGRMF